MKLEFTTEQLLKPTQSRCPVCHAGVPAEVWQFEKHVVRR